MSARVASWGASAPVTEEDRRALRPHPAAHGRARECLSAPCCLSVSFLCETQRADQLQSAVPHNSPLGEQPLSFTMPEHSPSVGCVCPFLSHVIEAMWVHRIS